MRKKKEPKIKPHPEIEKMYDQLWELNRQRSQLNRELNAVVFKLVNEERDKIIGWSWQKERKNTIWFEGDLVLGSYECSGPLGLCVFDKTDDPELDCCLFCDQPDDRK